MQEEESDAIQYFSDRLPVLFDVERPLEFQVGVVVIIDKLGDGIVMGASHHSAGRFFRFDCRSVFSITNKVNKLRMSYKSSHKMAFHSCWDRTTQSSLAISS